MRAMSAVLSVFVLLSAATVAAALPDDAIRQKIVGSWGTSAACADGRLTFNADGSFVSGGADAIKGTFAIDGGRLTGQTNDSDMPVMLVDFDGEVLLLDDGSGTPLRLDRCPAQ